MKPRRVAETDKELKYTGRWKATANVNTCAVVACIERGENPVQVKWEWVEWEWVEDELPTVDQFTCFGVDITDFLFLNVQIDRVIGKGKTQTGKMDVTVRGSPLGSRVMTHVF